MIEIRKGNPVSGRPAADKGWISPSQRVRWGDLVRAELARDPSVKLADLAKRTGAPPDLARKTRQLWLRRGAA